MLDVYARQLGGIVEDGGRGLVGLDGRDVDDRAALAQVGESQAGEIFLLGNTSWRILHVRGNDVTVATADPGGPNAPYSWVQGLLDFDNNNRSNWDVEWDIKKSPLWRYCGNSVGIWRCPADQSKVTPKSGPFAGQTIPRVRTMAMSIWVGGWKQNDGTVTDANCSGPEWRVYSKLSDMMNPGPARTWVLMDEREDRINYGNAFTDMHGYPDNPPSWRFHYDYPGSYHNRAGGFSFADGHAEVHKWLDPRTKAPITGKFMISSVQPSPNNRDMVFMSDHASIRAE